MKNVKALSLSTIITTVLTVILTIWSELSKSFKDILAGITGHHWVTKSAAAFIVFFVLYFIFARVNDKNVDVWSEAKKITWITILGILAISGFFVWHFFAGN